MSKSNGKIRFTIYAIALIPFILLLGTGAIMLNYHTGTPSESVFIGLNGYDWLSIHKAICVIVTPLILLHLFVKTDWVKRLFVFEVKGKFKKSNILIFVVFFLCLLTAVGSWLIFNDTDIASNLRGIHNKFGLLLIVMFGIHVWNYRKQIINQFMITLKRI
jgi:hypothetical protein